MTAAPRIMAPYSRGIDRIAALVVSHNNPELTNNLCKKILSNTKTLENDLALDLYVIETGSDLDSLSDFTTLWVRDKIRMTRGWNLLREQADLHAGCLGSAYDAYILFVNDAIWVDDQDLISTLWAQMKATPDCGQIHPYQTQVGSPYLRKPGADLVRTNFTEIICPMIRGYAWREECPNLLDNRFFYGWGLDYDMPVQLANAGFYTYLSGKASIEHHAFTSYRDRHITKEAMTQPEFMTAARENMYKGLIAKYNSWWPRSILTQATQLPGTPPDSLRWWLQTNEAPYLAQEGITL